MARIEAGARLVHDHAVRRRARLRSRAPVATLAVAALVASLSASAHGAEQSAGNLSKITAPSYVAIDASSGSVLLARRATTRRPIASLTKVMTGLLAIERGRLGARILVTPAAVAVEDYREGLVAGKRYRRITLLRSALMVSAKVLNITACSTTPVMRRWSRSSRTAPARAASSSRPASLSWSSWRSRAATSSALAFVTGAASGVGIDIGASARAGIAKAAASISAPS